MDTARQLSADQGSSPVKPNRARNKRQTVIDDGGLTPKSSKRQKTKQSIPSRMKQLERLTTDADIALGVAPSLSEGKAKGPDPPSTVEKRLRMWRKKPSRRFLEKLERARTQR
jgi:hypothetical protein